MSNVNAADKSAGICVSLYIQLLFFNAHELARTSLMMLKYYITLLLGALLLAPAQVRADAAHPAPGIQSWCNYTELQLYSFVVNWDYRRNTWSLGVRRPIRKLSSIRQPRIHRMRGKISCSLR